MSTNKGLRRRVVLGIVAGMVATAGMARADVVTDQAAAILVFPKIKVDTAGTPATDTIVQVTNTSPFLSKAHCFYVNANSHCSNANPPAVPLTCLSNADCNPGGLTGGVCVPGWNERDFQLTLTKRQPLSWRASQGLANPCPAGYSNDDCSGSYVPLSGGRVSRDGQSNGDTKVPPVEENPFIGELKCVQVDIGTDQPIDRNDLKGEATIVSTTDVGGVDASKYNAVGIQAIEGAQDGDPATLRLGGPDPEYNACPRINLLDHFFDSFDELDAAGGVGTHNDGTGAASVVERVATDIVVIPCSEDFLNQDPTFGAAILQFLIYNEFEQRFSTATRVNCFKEVQLSDIDTRFGVADNNGSIFNAAVQGTLTGQTRIRPVVGSSRANRVLILAQERWRTGGGPLEYMSTARNVQTIQEVNPNEPPDMILLTCPDGSAPPCF
ncbi:MAG: hypothetical protein HY699_07125 [Deltaproteobacteria bacterium]|nr:hypothetical protein [Deltaproteobacteria bacterium]